MWEYIKSFVLEQRLGVLPFIILFHALNIYVAERTWFSFGFYMFLWCAMCALATWLYRVEER